MDTGTCWRRDKECRWRWVLSETGKGSLNVSYDDETLYCWLHLLAHHSLVVREANYGCLGKLLGWKLLSLAELAVASHFVSRLLQCMKESHSFLKYLSASERQEWCLVE